MKPPVLHSPFEETCPASQRARQLAEHFCMLPLFSVPQTRHNWPLEQARLVGKAVLTLAGAWRLWEEARYAARAWEILEEVTTWPIWTWDKIQQPYDLTTGELAATFAMADEWLADWLQPEQKVCLRAAVQKHVLGGILECYREGKPAERQQWWLRAGSNWNAVCNGGAAMVALRWPDLPESARVTEVVWPGLAAYAEIGLQPDGSSLESIGYWQYGLIYFSRALLAWESAHQQPHPFLARPALREGLDFPFDFSPGGAAIGFGDANYFAPPGTLLPLFLRAERQNLACEVLQRLEKLWQEKSVPDFDPYIEPWPDEIFAAIHRHELVGQAPPRRPALRVYPSCGWMVFNVNDMSLSFRAGSTRVLHAMRELLAVNLAVGGQALLSGVENWPYPPGWFSDEKRDPIRGLSRGLFWEDNTTSKNAPLVNGIGQVGYADSRWSVDESAITAEAEATAAYPVMVRKMARSVCRQADGFTICDQWKTEVPCWFEARFYAPPGVVVTADEDGVLLQVGAVQARLRFHASETPVRINTAPFYPSVPSKPPVTMIRAWTEQPQTDCQLITHIES